MILILGETSFIGKYLAKFFTTNKISYLGSYFKKKKKKSIFFDLNNPYSILKHLKKNVSHVVLCSFINSKPELIKKDLSRSINLNIYKIIELFKIIFKKNIIPVYISSDAVFDGKKGFYKENNRPSPLNEYGKIKLEIEKFLIKSKKKFLIVRIGKVFSLNKVGSCFFQDIYSQLKKKKNVMMSYDHFFSPIYINDLCLFIHKLIKTNKLGIFHLISIKSTSWYETAILIMKKMSKLNINYNKKKIIPVSVDSLYSEKRGFRLTLNSSKFNKLFNFKNKNIRFYINLFFKNVSK